MSKLHMRVLSVSGKKVFEILCTLQWIEDFYLAGGTALALQLGHRTSIDFDFFSPTNPVIFDWREHVLADLNPRGKVEIQSQNDGTLLLRCDGVPMSYFKYPYPFIGDPIVVDKLRIASILDIGLMKIAAIIGRGRKRDFVDLYFIAQRISLTEILKHGAEKFPKVRDYAIQAARALVYFVDAEEDKMPRMFTPVQWSRVKKFFEQQVSRLSKEWLEI